MRIRGVIFDLDGTLADTLADLSDAVNAALHEFGYATHETTQIRAWIGEGLPLLCRRAMSNGDEVSAERLDSEVVGQVVTAVTAPYREHRLDKTRPYPGIPGLLDALTAQQVRLAVLTNKPHEHTEPLVSTLLGRYPWVVVQGCLPDGLRKPDPRTAWPILSQMRLRASEVAMVGDSSIDVMTGRQANLMTVGVTWGFRDRQNLIDAGVQYLIDRPEQLLQLL
jgi:phosphoglycolate phosphatase